MLTCPSDPPPQIVCPMDEVSIPQNHFCSAPPPPPPVPLFSSITPSCANDGTSGNRRIPAKSPETQSVSGPEAAPEPPAHNPSLSKRQREIGGTVQASEAKQPRTDPEVAFKDDFDAVLPEESKNQQKKSQNQTNISAAENVALHFLHRSAQNLDMAEYDMDTFGEFDGKHDIPSASFPNKWIIGPFFQSLKSKISSFTEIVMSPVKVFKANSADLHEDKQAFGTAQAQGQSGTEDTEAMEGAHKAQTAVHKGCKKLSMDLSAHGSGRADECPETEQTLPDFAPLRQSPSSFGDPVEVLQSLGPVLTSSIPLCPSVVAVGASQESNIKMPGAEELKGKRAGQAKPRKGTRNRKKTPVSNLKKVPSDPETTDVQLPVPYSLNSIKDDPGEDEAVLLESDGRKRENGHSVGESLQSYLTNDVNGRILRSTADNQPLEAPCDTAAGHGRAKRDVRWDAQAQNTVRRKRVTADGCSRNTQRQQLQRPTRKRQAVTNQEGKDDGEMLTAIDEAAEKESLEVGLVDSLDYKSGVTEQSWKGSSSTEKPDRPQRLETQTCLHSPDVASADDMDLETTIAIGSPNQTQQEPLAEVPCGPQDLRSVRECRGSTRNPQKRKQPPRAAFSADSGNTAIALPEELIEVRNPDLSPVESFQWARSCRVGVKPQSKRPKKALNSSTVEGSPEAKKAHLKTKENGSDGSDGQISASPLYFQTTPPDSGPQAVPYQDCYVKLDQVVMLADAGGAKGCDAAAEEPFPANTQPANGGGAEVSSLRSKVLRRRKGRRKCRVLPNRTKKVDEVANCISRDDSMAAAAVTEGERCGQLLRSYSCPEISTLHSSDASWNFFHSPHHPRIQPSQQHARTGPHHARKSVRRARRHTVCSVEVEREIAPLCLRKEVYPSRRPAPYDASSLNPSLSQSALASCFLSSPLAFLSEKTDGRGAPAGPGTPSHVSPPTFSLLMSPPTRPLSGVIQQPDSSGVMDPSGMSVQCEPERWQRCDVEDDGENTSSSSQEFEDVGLREEKALSDSEVKVMHKNEERGKVSSIRIRKTLPKPPNNLTPMGLPKTVRVKKKDFSLEEIYTNKNFKKPPESRLETIFEVPTSRRNGSVSSFGQKRMKRFLEFSEVGQVRKPKKPLAGVAKAGASTSRTRRGGPKDAAALSAQDVDLLLCTKLDQLNLWLIHDQSDESMPLQQSFGSL
ncbi:uncharacterized protein prr14 [Takifugu rubripes]|uniref:uncharacterized protein prr14 n=1 Tax=Takifugu rubripes TaxID=31033 RepID=UPI0011455CDF|nr:uncharacterized protein LOC105416495 [Takifugu rubripes]